VAGHGIEAGIDRAALALADLVDGGLYGKRVRFYSTVNLVNAQEQETAQG
jgi:hypothetical protein